MLDASSSNECFLFGDRNDLLIAFATLAWLSLGSIGSSDKENTLVPPVHWWSYVSDYARFIPASDDQRCVKWRLLFLLLTREMIPLMMGPHLLLILFFAIPASHQQQSPGFESSMRLTAFGTAFQPQNPIELLSISPYIRSLLRCAMQCNQNCRCRTFDYDQSSLVCRLFEGDLLTGTVLNNSTLSSSRVGSIRYTTTDVFQQYSAYNQSCDQCSIGVNRYLQCINNSCQCPPNTYWNGQMCLNQLYNGSRCNHSSECRQDLNLTCSNQTKTCIVPRVQGNVSFVWNNICIFAYWCDPSLHLRWPTSSTSSSHSDALSPTLSWNSYYRILRPL